MTRRQDFMAEAERRLTGLEGEARAAELAKLEQEIEPLIQAEVAEYDKQREAEREELTKEYVRIRSEQEAHIIVAKIAKPNCHALLLPWVLDRITVARNGDDWKVTISDKSGNPTSVDALREEFIADRAFAPIVRGASEEDEAEHARKVAEMLGETPSTRPQRLTRSEFDRLGPEAKAAAMKRGATILDH